MDKTTSKTDPSSEDLTSDMPKESEPEPVYVKNDPPPVVQSQSSSISNERRDSEEKPRVPSTPRSTPDGLVSKGKLKSVS